MSLTKTTHNFAAKRGFELEVDENVIFVYTDANDDEPDFTIRIEEAGFFFGGNIALPQSIKEELPHWMKDEKALRETIEFVAKELAA